MSEGKYTGKILYKVNDKGYSPSIEKWVVVGPHPNYIHNKQFYIIAEITGKTDTSIAIINWKRIAYADSVDSYFESKEEAQKVYEKWLEEKKEKSIKWLESLNKD
jgi:hypothetical protein